MDFFLLQLFNHCDEKGQPKSQPRSEQSSVNEMRQRDKNGKLEKINDLCRVLEIADINIEEDSPNKARRDLSNIPSVQDHGEVKEADKTPMKCINNDQFNNWGKTVKAKSILHFAPKTKVGICNIVKWSKKNNLKVRAAGFRHSWSNITIDDSQVLVSLLPFGQPEHIPAIELPMDGELQSIELLEKTIIEDGVEKKLCKIGAGTTNEHFREWIIQNSKDDENNTWKPWWTLPLNVIMVEITFGGSNGPICHGSGKRTTTLSDLVASIEFVNAKGELQTVDDPVQLKSVSGCFGMLGIVTSITMKLDPLTFACMIPQKKRVELSIPPPKGFDVPKRFDMSEISKDSLKEAFEVFRDSCDNDYYVEYFWYPDQDECWINSWKNDGDPSDANEYPTPFVVKIQEIQLFLGGVINSTVFRFLPGRLQVSILSNLAMESSPERDSSNPIVTPLIEAIHFRRGIHNMRCYDMEWEIPIPALKSDPSKPDYSVCQKAWWAAIKAFYEHFDKDENDVPMRLPLEMRITGGSSVNLAPQYGNDKHGTCSIEILTPANVKRKEWKSFIQEITDLWTNLKTDDGEPIHPFMNDKGQLLYVRPHWAKEWEGLTVHGKPINEYLVEDAYKDQIQLFREGLEAAAKAGGYSLKDAEQLFSTKFTREMLGEFTPAEMRKKWFWNLIFKGICCA
mmetsp:Transcript_24979/g.28896  ORF Transcript_24979/g.28896 Transcript_24979/m.28896 type:complete len:679 (-) Transcript_24979:146-2182(-)